MQMVQLDGLPGHAYGSPRCGERDGLSLEPAPRRLRKHVLCHGAHHFVSNRRAMLTLAEAVAPFCAAIWP